MTWTPGTTGAELIAAFIARHCHHQVFVVTGGACAFVVDALGESSDVEYVCFQHEQSAAMAADAVWRTTGKVGTTVATSGPGATNLVTGIACSWFDSIPTLHITGQVNTFEGREHLGVRARQVGFQETDICSVVSSLTKRAVQVRSTHELAVELRTCLLLALSHRMGPVLIDVPMDVQKAPVTLEDFLEATGPISREEAPLLRFGDQISSFLQSAERPLVVLGAGLGLSGSSVPMQAWCERSGIPYVASWGGLPYIDRRRALFQGTHGVYGARMANWAVQSADRILVLGSRLDNRQRTGNTTAFAPFAEMMVIDVDAEELGKFRDNDKISCIQADLSNVVRGLGSELQESRWSPWRRMLLETSLRFPDGTEASVPPGDLNPYAAVRSLQKKFGRGAIVAADCGANLCWVYQSYQADDSFLFTAGGNSPMGYSLPAAIGAQLANHGREVWCFIGDGGLQMNIQELQTMANYSLPLRIVILNNRGYGIIKQFQDAYFEGRHHASGMGYSLPDFEEIALAYGIPYKRCESLEDISHLEVRGPVIVDVVLPEGALISPKTEMDRFIHDQFPYTASLPAPIFSYPEHPSQMRGNAAPTV